MRLGGPDARGNVSVLLVAAIALAFSLCAAIARVGGAAADRARADGAADAAALAAADALALGRAPQDACSLARLTASENGARLLSCRDAIGRGNGAEVVVALGDARARARSEVDPVPIAGP